MEFLFFWFMFAVIVGVLASGRGRLGFGWFLLACIISPLIAGLLVLVLPNLKAAKAAPPAAEAAATPAGPLRPCPQCAEPIQPLANKCRHCGDDVLLRDLRRALRQGDTLAMEEIEVVGESRYQEALLPLAETYAALQTTQLLTAQLVPEPLNPYDKNAIRVQILGRTVGYLPRDLADGFEAKARKHFKVTGPLPPMDCPAEIRGGKSRNYGVVVFLPERFVESLHA